LSHPLAWRASPGATALARLNKHPNLNWFSSFAVQAIAGEASGTRSPKKHFSQVVIYAQDHWKKG
jgi:hypothetical protein